ncbi:hypothetical protein HPP92_028072, partial [Vanilla planifolia]
MCGEAKDCSCRRLFRWELVFYLQRGGVRDFVGVKDESRRIGGRAGKITGLRFLMELYGPPRGNMDRYQRVEKAREQTPIKENEVRITTQGRMRSYITYAMSLLQENGYGEIVFKAMGRAINKTVIIVELIKIIRNIYGTHVEKDCWSSLITTIGSIDITDTWEPLEEGLLPLETTRHVSMVAITLSKQALDTSAPGRNSSFDMLSVAIRRGPVKPSAEFDYDGEDSPRGRVRGRGGRGQGRVREVPGNGSMATDYDDGGWDGRVVAMVE